MPLDNFSITSDNDVVASIGAAFALTAMNSYQSHQDKADAFKLMYAAIREAVTTNK